MTELHFEVIQVLAIRQSMEFRDLKALSEAIQSKSRALLRISKDYRSHWSYCLSYLHRTQKSPQPPCMATIRQLTAVFREYCKFFCNVIYITHLVTLVHLVLQSTDIVLKLGLVKGRLQQTTRDQKFVKPCPLLLNLARKCLAIE